MPRKKDLEKRRELADRIFAIISERGVSDLSMTELARALGMKRTTLYWYFGDLGDVFDAVFDRVLDQYEGFMAERLIGVTDPIDQLWTLLEADVEYHAEGYDDLIALLQLWAVGRSQDAAAVLARGRARHLPLREMLIGVLRIAMEEGRMKRCDPEGLVDLILAIRDGIPIQRILGDIDPRPVLETVRERLLEPLRKETS